MHQELIEILYHTLWETVHVFFEHRELGHDVGEAGFLYPFLGKEKQETAEHWSHEVADSIRMKVSDDATLRTQVAPRAGRPDRRARRSRSTSGSPAAASSSSSATAARRPTPTTGRSTAWRPPRAHRRCRPSRSSLEPATLSAIANDVGTDVDLSSPAHRARAARRCRRRHLHQRRLAQRDDRPGRGAQARPAHRRAARLRRRRDPAAADSPTYCIVVGSDYIPRIQEVQASIYHVMRESLEGLRHAQA